MGTVRALSPLNRARCGMPVTVGKHTDPSRRGDGGALAGLKRTTSNGKRTLRPRGPPTGESRSEICEMSAFLLNPPNRTAAQSRQEEPAITGLPMRCLPVKLKGCDRPNVAVQSVLAKPVKVSGSPSASLDDGHCKTCRTPASLCGLRTLPSGLRRPETGQPGAPPDSGRCCLTG